MKLLCKTNIIKMNNNNVKAPRYKDRKTPFSREIDKRILEWHKSIKKMKNSDSNIQEINMTINGN